MSDINNDEIVNVTKEALNLNKEFLNIMIHQSIRMSNIFIERI